LHVLVRYSSFKGAVERGYCLGWLVLAADYKRAMMLVARRRSCQFVRETPKTKRA
jgi:hypothetical protein